jgi:hypothetical protein
MAEPGVWWVAGAAVVLLALQGMALAWLQRTGGGFGT